MIRNGAAKMLFAAALLAAVHAPRVAAAETSRVAAELPGDDETFWVGQRVPFFLKLRGEGPFVGTAAFSLPQVPRCVIVKMGGPVVSTEQVEGDEWYVQTHEFALFSQVAGTIDVPGLEVRFSNRDGYDGPVNDHVEQIPALRFDIAQPPGRDEKQFLVTTRKMEVTESWDPMPGAAKQGDVFRRTITQTADQMTGMALAPPMTNTGDGIRVYVDKPEVADKTERGDFTGTRRDLITYVLEEAGTLTIPAVTYIWWNPESEEYGSTTLPEVTFDVAAVPSQKHKEDIENIEESTQQDDRWVWGVLLLAAILSAAIFRLRLVILHGIHRLRKRLYPPERVAARRLLKAAKRNDAFGAEAAWIAWRNTKSADFQPTPQLRSAIINLQRHLYGSNRESAWSGDALVSAFTRRSSSIRQGRFKNASLPPLNPK